MKIKNIWIENFRILKKNQLDMTNELHLRMIYSYL